MVATLERPPVAIRRPPTVPAPTPRQQDLLEHLANGYTIPEAAERLGIATQTAKNRLAELYRAWGVHSQAEAIAVGLSSGHLEIRN